MRFVSLFVDYLEVVTVKRLGLELTFPNLHRDDHCSNNADIQRVLRSRCVGCGILRLDFCNRYT